MAHPQHRVPYLMHGLAPIAAAMDVNRVVAPPRRRSDCYCPKGLADYRERFVPRDHPSWKETYVNGDLITWMIQTEEGLKDPGRARREFARPYSRINTLAGSRGIVEDYAWARPDGRARRPRTGRRRPRLARLRRLPQGVRPLAVAEGRVDDDAANNGGHGGLDYVLQWRTVQWMLGWCPTSTSTTPRPGARRSR
ncbi:Glycosyl hydrolase family 109 protein OS=Streptomyces griseomycini OX=66895 GN=FHS37_003734 PE=3 SV=1 [Streptomyces griseomycini]